MSNPLNLAADLLAPAQNRDPSEWIAKKLNVHLWSKQREITQSVRDNKRTVVAACHASGKTYLAASLVCEWLENHQPGTAFVVTTAPSWQQVRAVLWRYINQLHARNALRGRVNQTEWHMGGELVAIGRKPADHDDSAMQGVHAQYVLFVLDEAGGIPEQLWTAAEAVTTGDDCRILAIGNPDYPQGPFREAWDSDLWHSIQISAFDGPAFTGEPCPLDVKRNLVTPTWVAEAKAKWGEESPVYQSKVLGVFPSSAEDSVIDYARLVAAINAEPPESTDTLEPTILGVDVAGGGTDMTVVRQRRGNQALKQWTTSLSDSAQLTDWLLRIIAETEATVVRIDSTGLGWGIVGSLREKTEDVNIVGINASGKPRESRFLNSRAEMWWSGRMKIERSELDLSEAEDSDSLLAQMTAPKWMLDSKGKIKIESKDDIRTRIGRSPDNADALLLAFYDRWGSAFPEPSQSIASMKLNSGQERPQIGRLNPDARIPTAVRIGLNRWQ